MDRKKRLIQGLKPALISGLESGRLVATAVHLKKQNKAMLAQGSDTTMLHNVP